MLTTLSELPKVIDAFISGVIEFVYRFVSGVLRVDVSPLHGSVRLQVRENELSSRTMLFCASALLAGAYFVTLPNLFLVGSDAGLGKLLLRVIVFYVVFDLLALLTARVVDQARKRSRAARPLMRYSFAASLGTVSLFAFATQALAIAGMFDFQGWANGVSERVGGAGAVGLALVFSVLFFYQPAFTFMALMRRSRHGRAAGLLGLGAAVAALPACLAVLYGIQVASIRVDGAMTGGLIARSVVCEGYPDKIHVTAVLLNQRDHYIALSRDSLLLEVALSRKPGQTGSEALAEGGGSMFFEKIEGGAVLVKPNDAVVFQGDVWSTSDEYRRIGIGKRRGACRLEAFRYGAPWIVSSSYGQLHKEYPHDHEGGEDEDDAAPPRGAVRLPGFYRPEDSGLVPEYRPGPPPAAPDPSMVPAYRPDRPPGGR